MLYRDATMGPMYTHMYTGGVYGQNMYAFAKRDPCGNIVTNLQYSERRGEGSTSAPRSSYSGIGVGLGTEVRWRGKC